MSRSGYSEDCEHLELWRGSVDRAIHGKLGQSFLRELAAAMDAMPTKELICGELINEQGACCAIGAVCKARGTDVSHIDYYDSDSVAHAVGVARAMAAEIEFVNDDDFCARGETDSHRWERMRQWVASNIAQQRNQL